MFASASTILSSFGFLLHGLISPLILNRSVTGLVFIGPIAPQWICVHLAASQMCTTRMIERTMWVNMLFFI